MPNHGTIVAMKTIYALEEYMEGLTSSGREDIDVEVEDWDIGKKYLDRSPKETFGTNAISELLVDLRRVEVMNRVSKALAASSSKLLDLCARTLKPFPLKLSKGLTSLSDDILSLVFKFIVHSDEDGSTHALRLSLVCRKFRRLSLADRTLWTTLCLRTGTAKESEKMERLISRSGSDADLHIAVKYGNSVTSTALHNAMSVCSATASRWRTLTVDGDWDDSDVTITDEFIPLMKQRRLTLPRLEEIHFRAMHRNRSGTGEEFYRTPIWVASTANFANIQTWQAPNLRVLRCTQYIPPPSFPFTTITTIILTLKLLPSAVRTQVDELVLFLNSQPTVSEFILSLTMCPLDDYGMEDVLDSATILLCPSVKTFQLIIPHMSSRSIIKNAQNVAAPIANAFRMPKLESFSFSIESEEIGCDFTDAGALPELFIPDPDHHPLLTSFAFTTLITGPESTCADLIEFDIPLDKLPRVSSLCVKTLIFGRFIFSRTLRASRDAALVDKLNALRELQLSSCMHLDAKALRAVVQSLKDVGAWDTLERVVIRDCRLLDYQLALEAVGKERLFFSES